MNKSTFVVEKILEKDPNIEIASCEICRFLFITKKPLDIHLVCNRLECVYKFLKES